MLTHVGCISRAINFKTYLHLGSGAMYRRCCSNIRAIQRRYLSKVRTQAVFPCVFWQNIFEFTQKAFLVEAVKHGLVDTPLLKLAGLMEHTMMFWP